MSGIWQPSVKGLPPHGRLWPMTYGPAPTAVQLAGAMRRILKMSRYLFTSESVTEGHPDKLCGHVADAIWEARLAQDPQSRCTREVTACPGERHIMGEITTTADVDYEGVAHQSGSCAGISAASILLPHADDTQTSIQT